MKIAHIIATRAIIQIFYIVIVICLCFIAYHFQSNAEKLESNQVDVIQ